MLTPKNRIPIPEIVQSGCFIVQALKFRSQGIDFDFEYLVFDGDHSEGIIAQTKLMSGGRRRKHLYCSDENKPRVIHNSTGCLARFM